MKRDIRQKVSEFAEKVAAAISGSVKAPKSDEETDVENSDFYACGSDGGGEEDGSYAAGADGSEDAFGEDENESENGEDPEEEESGDAHIATARERGKRSGRAGAGAYRLEGAPSPFGRKSVGALRSSERRIRKVQATASERQRQRDQRALQQISARMTASSEGVLFPRN